MEVSVKSAAGVFGGKRKEFSEFSPLMASLPSVTDSPNQVGGGEKEGVKWVSEIRTTGRPTIFEVCTCLILILSMYLNVY